MGYDDESAHEETGKVLPSSSFALGERLRQAIKAVGSDKAAESTGKSVRTLDRYVSGKIEPPLSVLIGLADSSGLSLQWLATGEEIPRSRGASSGIPAFVAEDIALVQKLELEASAGNGAVTAYDPGTDYIAFQASWLRAHDVNAAAARVLNVHGDSMEPTIRHGDVLLVDTSIDHIKDNAIYVLTWDDSVFVKRVHKRLNGSLQLISDNALYPPEDIAKTDVAQLNIAGRVVWYGRFT
ncbi:MAG: helix-turn-helix transcriptional regulator [Martelella sp.]